MTIVERTQELIIEEIRRHREQFMDLLLLADPSPEMIKTYLERGYLYVLRENDEIVGVLHLDPLDRETIEIKNVAIREDKQGKGHGKQLVAYVLEQCSHLGYKKIIVGTGNSSIDTLAFYQKMGFRFQCIRRDFFLQHYTEPIFENGIQCRDMIILEQKL